MRNKLVRRLGFFQMADILCHVCSETWEKSLHFNGICEKTFLKHLHLINGFAPMICNLVIRVKRKKSFLKMNFSTIFDEIVINSIHNTSALQIINLD